MVTGILVVVTGVAESEFSLMTEVRGIKRVKI